MPKTLKELLDTHEASTPFDPVPRGEYALECVDAVYYESNTEGVSPRVRVSFRVEGVEGDGTHNRRLSQTLFIDGSRPMGFIKKGYRLLTGQDFTDALQAAYPDQAEYTDDDMAQAFAAGVVGGKVQAYVGIGVNKRSNEEENRILRWID